MTIDSPRFDSWKNWMEREQIEGGDPRLYPIKAQFEAQGYLAVQEKGTFSAYNPWLKEAPHMFARGVAGLTTARSATTSSGIGNESVLGLGLRATIHASNQRR